MCGQVCTKACMWRSEGNLLLFYCVNPGNQTQITRLGSLGAILPVQQLTLWREWASKLWYTHTTDAYARVKNKTALTVCHDGMI